MKLRYVLPLFFILSSCDRRAEQEVEKLESTISKYLEATQKKISEYTPSTEKIQKMTQEEISALFTLEYRVVEVDSKAPTAELQALMTSLGKDRWDCFSVLPTPEGSRLLCKRQPGSALRYWTKFHSLIY